MVISPQAVLKVWFLQKLQPVRARGWSCLPSRLFLEHRRAPSAGSAVFEGPPVPLISRGTPRREWAPSPGPPHCNVLFLYPRSPHSVKLRGTSSISPVPHVNRRFNQTLLLGLPLCSPSNTLAGRKKRKRKKLTGQKSHFYSYLFFFPHCLLHHFLFLFPSPFLSTTAFRNFVACASEFVCIHVCACFLCGHMHFVSSCGVFPHWLNTHICAHAFRNKGGGNTVNPISYLIPH